jgi:hypothetical protein
MYRKYRRIHLSRKYPMYRLTQMNLSYLMYLMYLKTR